MMSRLLLVFLALSGAVVAFAMLGRGPFADSSDLARVSIAEPANGALSSVAEADAEVLSSVPFIDPEDVDCLLQSILFSGAYANHAFLTLKRSLGSQLVEPSDVSAALVAEVAKDLIRDQPRLRNSSLAARVLQCDSRPASDTEKAWQQYLAAETANEQHLKLRTLMQAWPSEAPEDLSAAVEALMSLKDKPLKDRVRELVASGDSQQRALVLAATRGWMKVNDAAAMDIALTCLWKYSPMSPNDIFMDMISAAETVQTEAGISSLHGGVASLGMLTAVMLEGELDRLTQAERAGAIEAALQSTLHLPDSVGSRAFAAMTLGAAGDGHPVAIERLANLVSQSEDTTVQSTAIVNLGLVGSVSDVLEKGQVHVRLRPDDTNAAMRDANGLTALVNSVKRHPEEAGLAAKSFEVVLRHWTGREDLELVRMDLMQKLEGIKVEPLRSELVHLAQSDPSLDVRSQAKAVLESWR